VKVISIFNTVFSTSFGRVTHSLTHSSIVNYYS
jgi:hypothetical protein